MEYWFGQLLANGQIFPHQLFDLSLRDIPSNQCFLMWQRGKLEIIDVFWKILRELKREGLETENYQIHGLIKTRDTVDMPLIPAQLLRRLR